MTQSVPSEITDSIPGNLQELLLRYWQDWSRSCDESGIDPGSVSLKRLAKVWACSEFVARLSIRRPRLLVDLLTQPGTNDLLSLSDYQLRVQAAIDSAEPSEESLMRALRQLRQQEMLRIACCDLEGLVSLEQTLHELSDFAEAMVSVVLNHLHNKSVEVMGEPMAGDGEPQNMLVLAMGKLGGRELNFSSDIDLIFFYPDDGHTQGGRHLSNHEFFIRLARNLVKVLGETTADGFVFRVDTRLRPYGESGPLVMSFTAAEQYYQLQGRDWERYAMIKARAIAGKEQDKKYLYALLKPFVYRRYLDFTAFESIREMKAMIDAEVKRKGFKDNVKSGRGGIREIEFIGQTYQLLRGGQDKTLQTRGIIEVLRRQGELKLLNQDEVDQLQQSYAFLRKLENRIQMESDRQTHNLPTDEVLRQKLCLAMGYDDWKQLSQAIEKVRDSVDAIFHDVVSHDDATDNQQQDITALRAFWQKPADTSELTRWLKKLNYENADEIVKTLVEFRNNGPVKALSEAISQKLLKLMGQLFFEIAEHDQAPVLFDRVIQLLTAITGRQVYINLLLEYPEARKQMLSLSAVSPWFVQQLRSNPILLDELLDAEELYQSKDRQALSSELDYLLASVEEGDLEQIMDRLRQFKNTQVMKTAVLNVSNILSVTDVGTTLSNIAEVILDKVLQLAWDEIVAKYGHPECTLDSVIQQPGIAIVAYGKLGGIELGYGSDLDIVFLHGSAGDKQYTAGEKSIDNTLFFSRVAQRVLHILGARMYSGLLYEVDIRLRPEGRSGMMVSSLNAFEQYQHEKAWTWEHQALLRARVVAGNDHVKQEFDRIRRSVLSRHRDARELLQSVVEMREKMRAHLSSQSDDEFNFKQDKGGIVDIEFLVQAGALLNAGEHPELLKTTSILEYLEGLEHCGWLKPEEVQALSLAYREYRDRVNRQALQIKAAGELTTSLQACRQQVVKIWERLLPAIEQGSE